MHSPAWDVSLEILTHSDLSCQHASTIPRLFGCCCCAWLAHNRWNHQTLHALVVYNLSNCETVHRLYLASGLCVDYLPGVVLFVYLPGVLLYNPLSWPVFHLRAETGYSDRFVSFAQGTP